MEKINQALKIGEIPYKISLLYRPDIRGNLDMEPEQTYEGASGRIQFNPYGDLSGHLYFYDLKGKEYAVQ